MKNMMLVLILVCTAFAGRAQADELFSSACAFEPVKLGRNFGTRDEPAFVMLASGGLKYSPRCQNLMSTRESMEILGAVIITPALAAMRNPEIATLLAGDALTAGITVANPTVMLITVAGLAAGGVIWVIINREIEECKEAAIQEEIKLQIERVIGAELKRPLNIKVEE